MCPCLRQGNSNMQLDVGEPIYLGCKIRAGGGGGNHIECISKAALVSPCRQWCQRRFFWPITVYVWLFTPFSLNNQRLKSCWGSWLFRLRTSVCCVRVWCGRCILSWPRWLVDLSRASFEDTMVFNRSSPLPELSLLTPTRDGRKKMTLSLLLTQTFSVLKCSRPPFERYLWPLKMGRQWLPRVFYGPARSQWHREAVWQ